MSNSYLIAIDGSEPSLKAVEHIIQEAANHSVKPQIYLVNVQAALPSNITSAVGSQTVDEYHRETGEALLAPAKARLNQAGLAHSSHLLVGEAAPSIVAFANEKGCTMIVMGAHGFGSVVGLFMGSVTVKVVHLSTIPVLLIK